MKYHAISASSDSISYQDLKDQRKARLTLRRKIIYINEKKNEIMKEVVDGIFEPIC